MQDLSKIPDPVKCSTQRNYKRLEGQLLTIVDTIGLPEKQAEAVKSVLRNTLWDFWSDEMAWIRPKLLKYVGEVSMTSLQWDKISDGLPQIEINPESLNQLSKAKNKNEKRKLRDN